MSQKHSFMQRPQLVPWALMSDNHIVLYDAPDWERKDVPAPNYEIAEQAFFALDDLPDETTEGARRRIAEMFSGQARSTTW